MPRFALDLSGLHQGCGISHALNFLGRLRHEGCIANGRALHAHVLLSAAEVSGNCRTKALVEGKPAADGKELSCWPLWAAVHSLRAAGGVCPCYNSAPDFMISCATPCGSCVESGCWLIGTCLHAQHATSCSEVICQNTSLVILAM